MHRRRGIGSALLQELLDRAGPRTVYITTVHSRSAFYSNVGFGTVPLQSVPAALWFEVAAGLVVARVFAGEHLIVMKRDAGVHIKS